MSRTTSPSALLGSPVGAFFAPSTETAVTLGTGEMPSWPKYDFRSAALYPPPSSMIATVCPAPVAPLGNSYSLATSTGEYDVSPAAREPARFRFRRHRLKAWGRWVGTDT